MPTIVEGDDALIAERESAVRDLTENVLPFWQRHAFDDSGWLRGKVLNNLTVDDSPDRHAVIAARILWTFSAAMRDLPADAQGYETTARHALDLLLTRFWDEEHGGVYWSLNAAGEVAADRKQVYAQAFAIYGLAQWHEASGDEEALAAAWGLFDLIEAHARDREKGGYLEALSREWGPLANTALSDKDLSVPKSMNTNLHVLEAYTTLLRVTGDDRVREALAALLRATLDNIVRREPWAHCALFFDADWTSHVDTISYGHDIEASWLLWDAWEALAASGLANHQLQADTRAATLALAEAVRRHGVDPDGSVLYEGSPSGPENHQKHWWPQAEGVVGWLNAYQLGGRKEDRAQAIAAWGFIEGNVIDRAGGEWFAELERDGTVRDAAIDPSADGACKIGPWKCPYHNARAALELLRRIPA